MYISISSSSSTHEGCTLSQERTRPRGTSYAAQPARWSGSVHLRLVRVSVPVPHAQRSISHVRLRLVRGSMSALFPPPTTLCRSLLRSLSFGAPLSPSTRMPRNRSTSRRMSRLWSDSGSSDSDSYPRTDREPYSFSRDPRRPRSRSPGEGPSRPPQAILMGPEIEMQPFDGVGDEESLIGPAHTTSAKSGNSRGNPPRPRGDLRSSGSARYVRQTAPSAGRRTPMQPARHSFWGRIQWRAIFTMRVSTDKEVQLHSGVPADGLHARLAFHLLCAWHCPGERH